MVNSARTELQMHEEEVFNLGYSW